MSKQLVRISTLSQEKLSYLLAEKLGLCPMIASPFNETCILKMGEDGGYIDYSPYKSWVSVGPLIIKYHVNIECLGSYEPNGGVVWEAWVGDKAEENPTRSWEFDPRESACRSILIHLNNNKTEIEDPIVNYLEEMSTGI